jgi:23S rRNA (guanosine2251-2'-O)-methyltransferase
MSQNKIYIHGKHAVKEALLHIPQAVNQIMALPDFEDKELLALAKKEDIPRGKFDPSNAPKGHQGIMAQILLNNLLRPEKQFFENLEITPDTCIVVLGELQDPHNVGAVIRSAAAFGATAVFIPEHNQAPITGAVTKVSAGMAFRVPLVTVPNVNNALRELKKKGFWIYGLEGESKHSIHSENFDVPTVIVLGNEAEGIREKTKDLCDILLSIPMNPACESLNAAASAAVTLYAWSVKHPNALKGDSVGE